MTGGLPIADCQLPIIDTIWAALSSILNPPSSFGRIL
jgi:hypothetical protein